MFWKILDFSQYLPASARFFTILCKTKIFKITRKKFLLCRFYPNTRWLPPFSTTKQQLRTCFNNILSSHLFLIMYTIFGWRETFQWKWFVFLIGQQLSGLQIIAKDGTHSGMPNFSTKTQVFGWFYQNWPVSSANLGLISVGYLAAKNGGQKTQIWRKKQEKNSSQTFVFGW